MAANPLVAIGVAIFIFILVVPICLYAFWFAGNTAKNALASVPIVANAPGNVPLTEMQQVGNNFGLFDQGITFVIIGISMTSLVYAAFIKASPLNFAYGMLVLIVFVFLSFYISNIAHLEYTQAFDIGLAAQTPDLVYIAIWLPVYIAIFMGAYLLVILLRYYTGFNLGAE
jgi:hypothetical protein